MTLSKPASTTVWNHIWTRPSTPNPVSRRPLRPLLDTIQIGGVGLGFWFAQQGSIYVFMILIFVYAWRMNRLDRQFHVDEV